MKFKFHRENGWKFHIKDSQSSYDLEVDTLTGMSVTFTDDNGLFIPDRSMKTYRSMRPLYFTDVYRILKGLKKGFSEQIIEVGPGLSEVITYITNLRPVNRPVVIDSADYNLMRDMLNEAKGWVYSWSTSRKIKRLVDRCELILNEEKVRFINEPLEEALELHPELSKSADIVIDIFGAIISGQENRHRIANAIDLEKRLLKEKGILLCSDYQWPRVENKPYNLFSYLREVVSTYLSNQIIQNK